MAPIDSSRVRVHTLRSGHTLVNLMQHCVTFDDDTVAKPQDDEVWSWTIPTMQAKMDEYKGLKISCTEARYCDEQLAFFEELVTLADLILVEQGHYGLLNRGGILDLYTCFFIACPIVTNQHLPVIYSADDFLTWKP